MFLYGQDQLRENEKNPDEKLTLAFISIRIKLY